MTKQTKSASATAKTGKKPAVTPKGLTATNSTAPGLASMGNAAKSGGKGGKP